MRTAKNIYDVSFPVWGQKLLPLTSFPADTPCPYAANLLKTISSHDHHIISGKLYPFDLLLLCTSHPGRIPALHDFHIQALAYRPVSFVSTIPVSSHMKTRFPAHAESLICGDKMASLEISGQSHISPGFSLCYEPDAPLH